MTEEVKDMLDSVIVKTIESLDIIEKKVGHPCRKRVLKNVEVLVTDTHTRLVKEMMVSAAEVDDRLARINYQAHVSYVLTLAVIAVAVDPNTQWDHGELWVEQLKHKLRLLKNDRVTSEIVVRAP